MSRTNQSPEQRVQNKILKFLKDKNIFFEKRQAGGWTYKTGLPDVYFVIQGLHCELEIKSESGSRSAMQEKWETYFINHGIKYCCVKSFEEFVDFFDEIKKEETLD